MKTAGCTRAVRIVSFMVLNFVSPLWRSDCVMFDLIHFVQRMFGYVLALYELALFVNYIREGQ